MRVDLSEVHSFYVILDFFLVLSYNICIGGDIMNEFDFRIHYTDGPEILADVSFEKYQQVKSLLQESYDDEDISNELTISQEAVSEIRKSVDQHLRRCSLCGAYFASTAPRRNTCYKPEHYLPCIDCGTPLLVKESYINYMKAGGRRCHSCRNKQIGSTRRNKSEEEKRAIVAKQEATMLERYGARNALQVEEIQKRVKQTVKERYGVDNLSQSPEIQARIRANSQEKYGVDHYVSAPEIQKRMKDGMVAKYGHAFPLQVPEIYESTKQTILERYGVDNVMKSDTVKQTFIDNHLEKYGVEWPHQRPDLIEQVKQSNIEKYGAAMFPISDQYMQTVVKDPSKFDNYKAFMEDPEQFITSHYLNKPTVGQLCEDLGVTDTPIYAKLISVGKRHLATQTAYTMETQLVEFISRLDPTIKLDLHNRKLLNRKEIDIYLPDYKIGFECNPTYTHNSSFDDPWGSAPKSYRYHFDKSKLASEQGIFIFHVFGYEWSHRRDLIKSQIQNLLGCNDRKIFARKTTIKEISDQEATDFLALNHRQGKLSSSIRLGLYLEDELVSVMTFGKMRSGIGRKSNQSDNEWELARFCNLTNTSVVGGASKLFKYFINKYNPDKVVSFSDVAHTRGNLYSMLGFKKISLSSPGYVWVNLKDDSYYSRVACQKRNLLSLFDDVTEETIATCTEPEIMKAHGYAQVFDSGVIRWEYTPANR